MGVNHLSLASMAGPGRASVPWPRFGSPPLAVVGHPSGEARLQPQHIVMRYICQGLCEYVYRIAIHRYDRSQPLPSSMRLFVYRGAVADLEIQMVLRNSLWPADSPLPKAARLRGTLGGNFMKFIPCISIALLMSGAAPMQAAGPRRQNSHSKQFADCLDEFSPCDRSALNVQELQEVRRVTQDRNFLDCFSGFSDCDKKQLNAQQQLEVARQKRDQNLQNCMDGIGECNLPELNDQDRQQVAQSARVRNFQTCLDGAGECDTTQLTVNQKQQVENANHDRNLQSCLEGLGQCDQAKFSSQEQQDVARANQDRNLRECLDGSDECDRGRLTAMEQREMAALNGDRKLQN